MTLLQLLEGLCWPITLTETHDGVSASKFAYGTRYLDRPLAIELRHEQREEICLDNK